jgi:hypothetical protein
MGKYLYPALFVLFLGLSLAAYAYIVLELDGSTLKTKQSISPPETPAE